ncbi:MAG: S9 family peptidase [Acidobacteria bacterium]|nr:S9 family peptidase [Acidobacteriota bacterium]
MSNQAVQAIVCAALVVTLSPFGAESQSVTTGRRPITAEDYYSFTFPSDPQLSPDGSLVAYVLTKIDREANRGVPSVWTVPAEGNGTATAVAAGDVSSWSPRWSPDGAWLAFISPGARSGSQDGAPQLHVRPAGGGQVRRVTDMKNGVSACRWAPDSKRLACISRTGPSDEPGARVGPQGPRHITRLVYKSPGPTWLDDRRSHIWVIDAVSGAARQITSGDQWDDTDPQWSPDGARIAFVSDRSDRAYDQRGDPEIWVVPSEGGTPRQVCRHEGQRHPKLPGMGDSSPRWSPDGKTIAFLAPISLQTYSKIWVTPADGSGPSRLVGQDLDWITSDLQWGDAGQSLYFTQGVKGEHHLFRLDAGSGALQAVTKGQRSIREAHVGPGGRRVVYVASDFKRLGDVCVSDLSGRDERIVAEANKSLWSQLTLADVERVQFKGAEGLDIDGFLVKPVGWQEGRKYPMVLTIHGGPIYMWGFDWYQEFQLYAAQGWAVFYANPRGSSGYGETFQRAVNGEWGGKAYLDIMNGVEAVLARFPWIDRTRLGVTGLSYGGFMTNWIVGHTNLFKAAVTVNGIANHVSQDGTRFTPFPRTSDFGGTLWEAFDVYWNTSPLKFAASVTTPTLILHGEHDYMVPLEQGEQWFRALKYFDVVTEMVVFPGANHFGLETAVPTTGRLPGNVAEGLKWRVYWFDRFLNGNRDAISPTKQARASAAAAK